MVGVPAGVVSITVYFHLGGELADEVHNASSHDATPRQRRDEPPIGSAGRFVYGCTTKPDSCNNYETSGKAVQMVGWTDIFRETAQQHTFLEIEPLPVEPYARYVSVLLCGVRLTAIRRGLDRLHGVVHSVLTLPSDTGLAEFSTVVAPPAFGNVKAGRVDRFIQLDHRLLGPVPYIGGALQAQIGLFTVPSSELTEPYIRLLQTLGEQAVVPFMALARPFVKPLVQGMNLLAGGGRGANVEIGFDTVWPQVCAGRVLALRMPLDEARARGVTLASDATSIIDGAGNAITDRPALIVKITAEERRADWPSIPELATAYSRVRDAYRTGRRAELNRVLEEFRRTAETCVDLLPGDREAAWRRVTREVERAGTPTSGGRGLPSDNDGALPPFDQLDLYDDGVVA